MNALTLDIAVRTLFGEEVGPERSAQVGRAFTVISEFLASPWANTQLPFPRWLPVPGVRRYYRANDALDEVIATLLAERRDRGPEENLLSILLHARDDAGEGLKPREIRDQVTTFLLAGH
ncbi:MAG: cytochrome P450, partial [Myxococcota bacterium]